MTKKGRKAVSEAISLRGEVTQRIALAATQPEVVDKSSHVKRELGVQPLSEAKLGVDLQAWINRTAGGPLKGQPPTPGPKTLACGHAAP